MRKRDKIIEDWNAGGAGVEMPIVAELLLDIRDLLMPDIISGDDNKVIKHL
jgi:hypothetical protein